MIQAENLEKSFPGGFRADPAFILRGFSMTAPNGRVTGILGANGAGKTTLFKLCAGLLRPDSGRVRVDGLDPSDSPEALRSRLSVLPEKPGLPSDWLGRDILLASAALRGLSKEESARRVEEAVERFGLADLMGRQARGYSRGQAGRVALGRELIAKAACVILDEPTAGLDFESAAATRRWARELAQEGRCVVIASHEPAELEATCDAIVGLKDGVAHSDAQAREWVAQARGGMLGKPPAASAPGPETDFGEC